MKIRIWHGLAIAGLLSLLPVLIPATPALALPEITLSPSSGSVGTRVTVTGTDFGSFKNTEVRVFFDNEEIEGSPLIVPENGTFTTYFYVPDGAKPGTVYVEVSTMIGGEVRKQFVVQKPQILLDTEEGAVGTVVTVEGKGFYAEGAVDVYYYKDGTRVAVGDEVATTTGEVTCSFSIPDSTAGEHTIMAEDALDNSAETSFEVMPAITPNSLSGAIGDRVTVSGTGFANKGDITVYFNNDKVVEDTANKYGSFEFAFDVPRVPSGTYDIEVEDDEGNRDTAEFAVAAGASLSQSLGAVDTPVIVSGVGFNAGSLVTIVYDTLEVATAIPGNDGAFAIVFNVPPSTGGNHIITVTDGTNTAECIFTMESEAPLAPELFLPEDESKSGLEVYFDWEDINDPSGVTYALQVATKQNFTASSILLMEDGLTDSEYTISEEAALKASSKEAPYYWRVKVMDRAANESEWSTTRSFYVGSSFTLPNWARNLLIGVGVGAAVFLGFWLGRRTAYSRRG